MTVETTASKFKQLKCPLNCPRSFTAKTNYDLKRHLIGTHGLEQNKAAELLDEKLTIKCHICAHKVSSKKRLIEHLNSIHLSGIQIEECVLDSKQGMLTRIL